MRKEIKNENIHEGFSQQEIRDFLAQELRDLEKEGVPSVEYAKRQIEIFQNMLKYAKKADAVRCLIEEKGWKEWDVSDDIPYNRETYFSFVGTEEEFKRLLELLKKEGK